MNGQSQSWLSDVVIFNESDSYERPGDVSTYRNIGEMCSAMEAWMLESGGTGFALNGLGQKINMGIEGGQVVGSLDEVSAPDLATLTLWLMHTAKSVHDARLMKSRRKPRIFSSSPSIGAAEANGVLPGTIEGLLAYIHM